MNYAARQIKRKVGSQKLTAWALAFLFLAFAFETRAVPSSISSISPAPNGVLTNSGSITVTFSGAVTGAASDDIFLNGTAATNVFGSGATYTYVFPSVCEGILQAVWNPAHSVRLVSNGVRLDELDATTTWNYSRLDADPPGMSAISPLPGSTLGQLTQILITFNEPVAGVDAADLQVNARSARSVTGTGAGPYVFEIDAPAPGTVQVSWLANHGIHDLAASANVFAGTGWTYLFHPGEFAGNIVINEFLASNLSTNGLRDEDGELQDWIELYNRGSAAVNLQGWSLAEDENSDSEWIFPAVTMEPAQYLVVFASAKNRKPINGAPLHASFRLGAGGQYLALFNANQPREVATRFQPEYPAQRADVSYGLSGSAFGYLTNTTPGSANSGAAVFSGFAEKPKASVKSGFFALPLTVTLNTDTLQATIRYTLDGSEPTPGKGFIYSGPISVAPSVSTPVVNLRAVAYRSGLLCSQVSTFSYIFPAMVLQQSAAPAGFPSVWVTPDGATTVPADYEMDQQVLTSGTYATQALQALTNLPALSIVLGNDDLFSQQSGIYANPNPVPTQREAWERGASAELIMPDGSSGFRIDAGLRVQGGTSRDPNRTRKHSLRLFFNQQYDGKLDFPVFEDSPRTRFNTLIVDAGSNITWHNRMDSLSYRAQYIRDQFVSDLQLAAGSPATHGRFVNVFLNGLFWGVCYLHERPDEQFAAAYFGGDESEYDVIRNTEGALEVVNGDSVAWTAMMSLVNSGLSSNAQYDQIRQYLDVDRFIDYMIVNIWAGNTDWSMHNWYASRRRAAGAGFTFQVWDAEYTMKSISENVSGYNHTGTPTSIHSFLRNNAEYRQRFADHLQRLCSSGGPLFVNTNAPAVNPALPWNNQPGALYMKRAAEVDLAMVLESARWGDAAPGRENNPFTRNVEFINELNWMKNTYLPGRTAVVLGQFRTQLLFPDAYGTPAPVFNQAGGNVPAAFNLTMSAPVGTIYYTTNGSDPRIAYSGGIAPGAVAYTGTPLSLNSSVTVKARARNGAAWSPLNEAAFAVAQLLIPVRITELMYRPTGGGSYEFLELKNVGGIPLDLSGHSFDGITFSFPAGSVLQPGAVAVLANNSSPADWAARYPAIAVAGYYSGQLDNSGERIALKDAVGRTIISVDYSATNGWPNTLSGRSIELIDFNGDPDDPANWRLSGSAYGTPGIIPAPPALPNVRLNEVMARNVSALANGGTFPDWVEIANTGVTSINLAGWSLTDDGNARKFIFPSTTIPAGGYLMVFCDAATSAPGLHTGFALGTDGETIGLYDAQTNRIDAVTFGHQLADLSVGRIGSIWKLTTPTPGGANAPAATASSFGLKINEWLANSAPGLPDWFEIYNPTAEVVALRGLYAGTAESLFQISALSFLAPGDYLRFFADEKAGADQVDFKLPSAGGTIAIYDEFGAELDRISYSAQTEGVSEGRYPNGSATLLPFPGSASPGTNNFLLTAAGLQLNEVLARNEGVTTDPWGGNADWIEIYNAGATAVNLAGMSLSEGSADAGKWLFPSAILAAGGYLMVWCDGSRPALTNAAGPLNLGSSLSGESGAVYLFNAAGQVVDLVEHGFQVANRSIGRSGGAWRLLSAPTPGAFNSAAANLGLALNVRLNEWMAEPVSGEDWFELYNLDSSPVELSGLHLTDDPSIAGQSGSEIPSLSFISGHGWVKFVADGNPVSGFDHVNFKLDGAGETLRIYDANFTLIDSLSFGFQQAGVSQGRLPDGGASVADFVSSPTPGSGNYLPLPSVAINEVLSHTDPPLEDAIELVNLTGQPVDVSGWYLSDSETDFKKFLIPAGSILPAGGFKVFYEYQFNSTPGVFPSFALDSARGDSVYLSQASNGNLTGQRSSVTFGAAENGVSFGRFTNSTGIEFVRLSQRTFGSDNPVSLAQFRAGTGLANSAPKVGPIVISELMYQPTGTGTNLVEQAFDEFIEIFNNSQNAVALYDLAAPTNRWRLSGGVAFTFPSGIAMPSQSYLLVVGFDPTTDPAALALFRTHYGVSPGTPVYGPFSNRLGNQGETIELQKPDSPQTSGSDAGFVPYILVEQVSYLPFAPWPLAAAGGGGSLQRQNSAAFGNDPLNWKGESPTAGRATADQSLAPVIVAQPEDKIAFAGSPISLKVTANGAEAMRYRWQRNNADLAGQTNAVLYLPSAQPPDSGLYRVEVSNLAGVAWSHPAVLTVAMPPVIVANPISQSVASGSPVSLRVTVSGTGPFAFQWHGNGWVIPGATNDVLTFSIMSASASGTYWVSVSNAVGFVQSDSAQLSIVGLDSDGDGMSDAWELAHNLNPFDSSDALIDSDGDGMLNSHELLAGTNPQDAQSVLRLEASGVDSSTGQPRIRFTAMANIGYTIQWTALLGGTWSDLISIPADPASRHLEITDSAPAGPVRLYRVLVSVPQ